MPLDRAMRVLAVLGLFAVGTPGLLDLAASIEEVAFPVRTNQRIERVVRNDHRLCWTWVSDKVRDARARNIDVFLDAKLLDQGLSQEKPYRPAGTPDIPKGRAGVETFVSTVYSPITNEPWRVSNKMELGHHEQLYCTDLPSYIGTTTPVQVRMKVYYPGWWGLWTVSVTVPPIKDPTNAVIVPLP